MVPKVRLTVQFWSNIVQKVLLICWSRSPRAVCFLSTSHLLGQDGSRIPCVQLGAGSTSYLPHLELVIIIPQFRDDTDVIVAEVVVVHVVVVIDLVVVVDFIVTTWCVCVCNFKSRSFKRSDKNDTPSQGTTETIRWGKGQRQDNKIVYVVENPHTACHVINPRERVDSGGYIKYVI